ncbi:MAG: 23S rRNA (adenine(2503)-C(2))-methyltransferase RlmN [Oscillospiraceae bacterium]|jgi:23S rRNA (adenine2503-C2)-methyltransferase|nr:23S rRNA (adenine(2503)-C(2))-methyltransferase RlmN [Oscillospiraceae bacterium]
MTPPELEASLTALGEPTFRAKQIFAWLHRGARSFEVMSNLSKALRDRLGALYFITAPALARKQVSAADGTVKYLWSLADGECVESVVMRYEHGNTVCVSSQVGCRMGCAFCASTLGGLRRNLTPSEILDQVIFSQLDSGARVSNVVLMGIGEPLDNFGNVLRFLELVTHPDGLNLGMRHISLSTCGLTENLDKLGAYNLQLTLSVSLHAPDDATRSRLMPVNRDGGVAALMDACRRYFAATGRRVTFEYAMIDGVNDTEEHARALVRVLRGGDEHRWHLNLIPLNPVPERALAPSRRESVEKFTRLLERGGVNFTIRRRLGADIDAACGQLRRSAVNRETRQQGE